MIQIRIPRHLWDYNMAPGPTVFLAFLYELISAHLRGDRKKEVRRYDRAEIVENCPIKISDAMFYRYRNVLIRRRLLIQDENGLHVNPLQYQRWVMEVDKFAYKSLENSM